MDRALLSPKSLIAILGFSWVSIHAADREWVKDAILEKAASAVVTVQLKDTYVFTGFIASADGLVITSAAHLEGLTRRLNVYSSQKKLLAKSSLLALDLDNDLAVLGTERQDLPFLKLETQPLKLGATCAIIYSGRDGLNATDGVLLARKETSLRPSMPIVPGILSVATHPQLNISPGGPILSAEGTLAGILVVGSSELDTKTWLGVPTSAITAVLAQARANRRPIPFPKPRTALGLGMPKGKSFSEATQLGDAGDILGAVAKMQEALEENPGHPLILTYLSRHYLFLRDFPHAHAIAAERLRLNPRGIFERFNAACLDLEQGRSQNNTAMMNKGLETLKALHIEAPHETIVTASLASTLLLTIGPTPETLAILKQVTELEAGSRTAWQEYSQAALKAGNFDEWSRARDRASELDAIIFELTSIAPRRKGSSL